MNDDDEPGEPDGFAAVSCPWCGAGVELALDPGSGGLQRYVEDCAVCCRPWDVTVRYDQDGNADVTVERADD